MKHIINNNSNSKMLRNEMSHLNAGMSRQLDGCVVVTRAQEMIHQHTVESFLAPLRRHC